MLSWRKFKEKIKVVKEMVSQSRKIPSFVPAYRLVEITQTDKDEHLVTVQVVNKSTVFQTKPEEILANDKLVDQFSPRDVRALTYLGYLSLHSPKYIILAQRLSEQQDKVLFALRKKGQKNAIIKTADEILKEKEILDNLSAKDSHRVGYTIASENILLEKKLMENLLSEKKTDDK